MWAVQQYPLGVNQPFFGWHASTLGAGAVFTGVVPDAVEVVVFTVLRMSAQGGGTTGGEFVQGFQMM